MIPIGLRSLLQAAALASGLHETPALAEQPTRLVDTTQFPIQLELPARMRGVEEIDALVCVHVTDVKGGFGVARSAVKRWQGLLLLGKVPAGCAGLTAAELALAERYSRVAYHWVASRALATVRNHPIVLRTSHGNGGNRGVGVAIDCGHAEQLPASLVMCGRATLTAAILDVQQATGRVVKVVPHRVFSGKRRVDTDAIVWLSIVLPVVEALGSAVCRIDYELAEGTGRPIHRDMDPHALFDARGRRLAA